MRSKRTNKTSHHPESPHHAVELTIQTASNPLGGVPPTQLLRVFRQRAEYYIDKIRNMYDVPFEEISLDQLETLGKLSGNLLTLSQVLLEIGSRLNPFAALEYDADKRQSINWISFNDYQHMYDFYLTNALPNFRRRDFYGWLCHDIIQQTYLLNHTSSLLIVLARLDKSDSNTHCEMTNQAQLLLWKFEAIVNAAATYEQQQFDQD